MQYYPHEVLQAIIRQANFTSLNNRRTKVTISAVIAKLQIPAQSSKLATNGQENTWQLYMVHRSM